MEVTTPDGYEWLVHSTDMFPVGEKVGIHVDPFDIQIMNKRRQRTRKLWASMNRKESDLA